MYILLIDDHMEVARALRMVLELRDHEVRWVGTGSDALAALSETSFDLILCDIWLTDTDGYSLMDVIRHRCDTPAVALSSDPRDLDPSRCLGAGFSGYCDKAFDIDRFLDFLNVVRSSHVDDSLLSVGEL